MNTTTGSSALRWRRFAVFAAFSFPLASLLVGAPPDRKVDGILDNSFLVEEAYNQEPGVVQHIFTALYGVKAQPGADERSWELAFTQEWPVFSQKHQLSYTLPYSFVCGGGLAEDGLGDIMLNYRYQALFDEHTLRAFAPRFSLILPTGDADRGFGEDTLGYQINLPFSTALGEKAFVHLNAGTTFLPGAASADDRDLLHFNLGASVIYAATRDLHFMLEWVGEWNEALASGGGLDHEFASVISPGLRKAFNFSNGSQIVAGVAAPIGLTGNAPDYGVFLYLSIEHFFQRQD